METIETATSKSTGKRLVGSLEGLDQLILRLEKFLQLKRQKWFV